MELPLTRLPALISAAARSATARLKDDLEITR
jgi:hypothetical protein